MAILITGRMAFIYWGKQSLSTTWPSPAKQSILFTMTRYGKTSWNSHGQKWRRKCASTCNRRASSIFFSAAGDTHLWRWRSTTGSPWSVSSPSFIGGGSWSYDLEMVVRVWFERIQQCKWLYTEVPPAYTAWPVIYSVRHSGDSGNK